MPVVAALNGHRRPRPLRAPRAAIPVTSLADELREEAKHLRWVADKTVAHPKPLQAMEDKRVVFDGKEMEIKGHQFLNSMVIQLVRRMSDAYLEVCPFGRVDPTLGYDDPLFRVVPTKGLPFLDYHPHGADPLPEDPGARAPTTP